MTLDWQTIKNTSNNISKDDFFNLSLNELSILNEDQKTKIFKDFCFLKENENELSISKDIFLYFGFKDRLNNDEYEFDTLFYLRPNENYKNRKKIIVSIEFHDARYEGDADISSLEKCFKEKMDKSIKYFFNLLNDRSNHYLDFYFFYKDNKNTTIKKRRISFSDGENIIKKRTIYNKKNYNNFSSEKNIHFFLQKTKTEAITINSFLDAIKYKKDKKILDNFLSKFLDKDNKKKYFVFQGDAGSGKTILAFQIKEFLENQNGLKVLIQIINQNFCKIIKEKMGNNKNIFFHTNDIIDNLKSNKFDVLIIDEAQRLDLDIFKNFSPNLKIILLGDHMQMINPKRDKFNIKEFSEGYFSDLEVGIDSIENFELSNSRRFSRNNLKWLKYIFNDCQEPKKSHCSNFKISNFSLENEFIMKFNESNYKTKCFTSIEHQSSSRVRFEISSSIKDMADKEYFLEKPCLYKKYVFSPYDIISKEVDANFIYLPYEFVISKNKNKTEFLYGLGSPENIDFYKRQYWVLLTRARHSIYIYAANPKTREYLEKKCKSCNIIK